MLNSVDAMNQLDVQIRAYEEEIAASQEDCSALVQRVAELKTRRNMCTSRLVQLPAEVIAHMIQSIQCCRTGSESIATPWTTFDPRWTTITMTCRRIRDVAVGCPQLWSLIQHKSGSSIEWLALRLARAKECPLELRGSGFGCLAADYEGFQCLKNTRRIDMPMPNREASANAGPSFLERTLPFIEVIHFSHAEPTYAGRTRDGRLISRRVVHHFSPHFLGGASFTLRALTLHNVVFSEIGSAPSLPALMYLDVHFSLVWMPHDVDQFVALLDKTPSLERLGIECKNLKPHHYGPVSLPNLHTLVLVGQTDAVVRLAQFFPHPSRQLSVTCTHVTREHAQELLVRDFVLPFWARALGTSHPQLPHGSLDTYSMDRSLTFGTPFFLQRSQSEYEPRLYLHFSVFDHRPGDIHLPLDSVSSLSYSECRLDSTDTWLSALAPFVQRIIIIGAVVCGPFRAQLVGCLRERAEIGRPLGRLEFRDFEFGKFGPDDFKDMVGFAEMLVSERLVGSASWPDGMTS
jgi:hypothetical protein